MVCGEITRTRCTDLDDELVSVELHARVEGVDDDIGVMCPELKIWRAPFGGQSIRFDCLALLGVASDKQLSMMR